MHKNQAFSPIRSLQSAWEILKKAPLPMWVGGLILVFVQSFGSAGGGGGDLQIHGQEDVERMIFILLPLVLLGFLMSIVIMAVTAWLKVGYYNGVETVMRTGSVEFEELFKGRGRWLGVFLTLLLQLVLGFVLLVPMGLFALVAVAVSKALDFSDQGAVIMIIFSLVAYVPVAIFFYMGLVLMPYPAALKGLGPMESLAESWRLASGVRLQLFMMILLQVAMTIVGLLACCVGVLPAGIIAEVMFCEAYVQAARDDLDDWWVTKKEGGPQGSDHGGSSGRSPASGTAAPEERARVVEAQTKAAPEIKQPPGEKPEGFDPSAWRQDSDIPPIEED